MTITKRVWAVDSFGVVEVPSDTISSLEQYYIDTAEDVECVNCGKVTVLCPPRIGRCPRCRESITEETHG